MVLVFSVQTIFYKTREKNEMSTKKGKFLAVAAQTLAMATPAWAEHGLPARVSVKKRMPVGRICNLWISLVLLRLVSNSIIRHVIKLGDDQDSNQGQAGNIEVHIMEMVS
jgi:hypothetical protein